MDFTAGFQIFNLLLLIVILIAGAVGFATLLKVLFKLNKALDIWLEKNTNNPNNQ